MSALLSVRPLGFPMTTLDPFLFAVYHKDLYPAGAAANMFAPRRGNGADFDWSLPYRMYHGDKIPGFPQRALACLRCFRLRLTCLQTRTEASRR